MKKNILIVILLTLISTSGLVAEDIRTIVIAPSKKPQSISTVGSSVTVYTEEDIANSTESFLHNILKICPY